MVGQRSGCSTCLGQVMKVHIVSVNVSARLRNVVPLWPLLGAAKRAQRIQRTKNAERYRMTKRPRGKR